MQNKRQKGGLESSFCIPRDAAAEKEKNSRLIERGMKIGKEKGQGIRPLLYFNIRTETELASSEKKIELPLREKKTETVHTLPN